MPNIPRMLKGSSLNYKKEVELARKSKKSGLTMS
jgi:hypothetical protein